MIDLAIVLAFVAYAVTSGFLNREQASKGLDEYFLAGKVPAPGASFEISVALAAGGLVLVPVWWPAVKRRTSRLGLAREG